MSTAAEARSWSFWCILATNPIFKENGSQLLQRAILNSWPARFINLLLDLLRCLFIFHLHARFPRSTWSLYLHLGLGQWPAVAPFQAISWSGTEYLSLALLFPTTFEPTWARCLGAQLAPAKLAWLPCHKTSSSAGRITWAVEASNSRQGLIILDRRGKYWLGAHQRSAAGKFNAVMTEQYLVRLIRFWEPFLPKTWKRGCCSKSLNRHKSDDYRPRQDRQSSSLW